MSLCIRSISNGSRYVPTFVASAQGCASRRFSSRQLPKHVSPVSSPIILNEFLGSNVSVATDINTEDNIKLSFSLNNSVQSTSVHINHLLDGYCIDNISSENDMHMISDQESYESLPQDINRISFMASTKDPLVLSNNNFKAYKNQVPVFDHNQSNIYANHTSNSTVIGTCTKDNTKVRFSPQQKITLHSSTSKEGTTKKSENQDLEHVYETLSVDLPQFFSKSVDYRIYHPEIEFVNNIRGTVTRGMYHYVKQLALLKTVGHLRFAYIKMDVLKITMHTQDNTVRVRWRINGIGGLKIFLSFWRFKVWKIRSSHKEAECWYDGFSTFYVGDDGRVYKHVADKMMPDQEIDEVKSKDIPSKIASQLTFSSLN